MDEILQSCRALCSDDFSARAKAYQALRNSREFTAITYRLHDFNLTAYDLARLLASGTTDAMAKSVLRLFEEQFKHAEMLANVAHQRPF